jgi:hypothetical protein
MINVDINDLPCHDARLCQVTVVFSCQKKTDLFLSVSFHEDEAVLVYDALGSNNLSWVLVHHECLGISIVKNPLKYGDVDIITWGSKHLPDGYDEVYYSLSDGGQIKLCCSHISIKPQS